MLDEVTIPLTCETEEEETSGLHRIPPRRRAPACPPPLPPEAIASSRRAHRSRHALRPRSNPALDERVEIVVPPVPLAPPPITSTPVAPPEPPAPRRPRALPTLTFTLGIAAGVLLGCLFHEPVAGLAIPHTELAMADETSDDWRPANFFVMPQSPAPGYP